MNEQSGDVGTEIPERSSPTVSIHQEIEIILTRQLAGYLALPLIIIDPWRTVVYYNEPMEQILGRRFDDAGSIPATLWSERFEFMDESGATMSVDNLPMIAALRERQPAYQTFTMRGLDGVQRRVLHIGLPLVGNAGRFLGAIGIFWELGR